MANKRSTIAINVEMDENNVPESMSWSSTENGEGGQCKASMISIWDSEENNTLKIDLWTKDMTMDDMKIFIHQNILTMADMLSRSTGEEEMAGQMKEFGRFFGEELGIIDRS
jgi:gliding motility-associated protein GldC